jgi:hypothetical protein
MVVKVAVALHCIALHCVVVAGMRLFVWDGVPVTKHGHAVHIVSGHYIPRTLSLSLLLLLLPLP